MGEEKNEGCGDSGNAFKVWERRKMKALQTSEASMTDEDRFRGSKRKHRTLQRFHFCTAVEMVLGFVKEGKKKPLQNFTRVSTTDVEDFKPSNF